VRSANPMEPDASAGIVATDSSVYYQSDYWNDLALVRQYLNRRATGDPDVSWFEHLTRSTGRTFAKALVLNCGNGWVERSLVTAGLVKEAVGVDYAEDLLVTARTEADSAGLPLRYHRLDTNSARWPEDGFDLVVNFAAAHHVAYLDRVFRSLAELLPDDGLLVSWDYLGAHRNQYPTAQWEAAWQANEALPAPYRHDLVYPHLPTMLVTDPTEAIHAELIMPVMRRYFDIEYFRALGGGVAYPVLTFNKAFFSRPPEEVAPAVEQVLAADAAWTDADPEGRTLFGYVVSRPRRAPRAEPGQLAAWTREEEERERAAAATGGRYYPDTFLSVLYERLDQAQRGLAGAAAERDQALARLSEGSTAAPPPPAPPRPSRLARLRANPRLRAAAKRVPGVRPTVLAVRHWRAARAGR
jgi:SAM-dependent methyltransferase